MFDFDFAYSEAMQIILFFASCFTTLFFYTFTTNILLLIYGEKVSFKRKAIFVVITGTVMNNFWTYSVYLVGGMLNFSNTVYNLVTIPNPIFALLFFLLGVKVLGLSPFRSIRLLTNTYIFIMVIKIFQRMIGFIFFPQTGGPWNYFSDAVSVIVCTLIYSIAYLAIKKYLVKSKFVIRLTDSAQLQSLWKEILLLLVKTSLIYGFLVYYPVHANVDKYLYLPIMFVILGLVLWVNVLNDAKISARMEITNKAVHVKILNDVIDGFGGLRHDLNNILQTYGGYIATENLEKLKQYHQSLFEATVLLNENDMLNKKLEENPALVSLLMQKHKLAIAAQVNMRINIICTIDELYISELDLCRSVGNLLDNAIEAARESAKKWVGFSIETKMDESKLIVVSNSTKEDVDITSVVRAGVTSKEGHTGMGLNHTRKMLSKYANCAFQVSYYDHEFTAYINVSAT